jgi:predicted PurR-regulated permease PerM
MSSGLRKLIHCTLLTISIIVSAYVLLQMTNNIFIIVVMSVTIAAYETIMQYVFAIGKMLLKIGTVIAILGAIVCFLLYGTYVFAYAVPTGIEFYAQQIESQNTRLEVTTTEYDILIRQIKTNQDALDAYNLQMVKEAETGYGGQSEKVTKEYNKLLEEQKELLERLQEVSDKKTKMQANLFYGLSKYLNPIIDIPPGTLQFIMFMALFLTIYLGLIFTSWDVTPQNKAPKSSEKVSQSSKKVPEELQRFVDASIRDTLRVNSPQKVAEMTGIPEEKCKEYRAFLDALGVIETQPGASRVKYPKDVVMKKVLKGLKGVVE